MTTSAVSLNRLLLLGLGLIGASLMASGQAQPEVKLTAAAAAAGQFERMDFTLDLSSQSAGSPAQKQAEVFLRITTPHGEQVTIPAFLFQKYERRQIGATNYPRTWLYPMGTPVWQARYAPLELGDHQAVALVASTTGSVTSAPVRFECVASARHGFVRPSRRDPRFLEFTDGRPFFPIGQNLAFIGPQQYVTLAKAEEILGQLAAHGANYLRIWACGDDWAMAIESRKSAWGRSWDWHPPTVPMPEDPSTNRLCLWISPRRPALQVNPSYPVALRPSTRYLVTGRIRTDTNTQVQLRVRGKPLGPVLTSAAQTWQPFQREFETGPEDYWLEEMSFHGQGGGSAWLADLSLKEAGGGPELLWEAEFNRPAHGNFNPVDCFMLDELLTAAERSGIYLQVCLLARDLYMNSLKDPMSPEYGGAIGDAKKVFRYAVARWGYSTSLAAWEYWNEMNPNLPTGRFYTELGEYLEQTDVYHHLRTTSTWGPSVQDCRHPKIDLADVHFYLRPSDQNRLHDEVEAVLNRTQWLREQAPDKPAHLGEFGLADEKWQITPEMKNSSDLTDVHNSLWASALSGACGTALGWWWERFDQGHGYSIYRPLAHFLAGIPWNEGTIQPAQATVADARLKVTGLMTSERAWLWIFDRGSSWSRLVLQRKSPAAVEGAVLELKGLRSGPVRIRWWSTRSEDLLREESGIIQDGQLKVTAPAFLQDLACEIAPPR